MEILSHILGITFPFFSLVLCGYAAVRTRFVSTDAIPGLNVFVLYLALPAMLFRFAAETPIASLMDTGTALTYLLCALAMLGFTVLTTRRGPIGWNDASFGALVTAFPNTGFLGVPLLVAMLGPRAAAPAIVALSVDMVLTSSLCIATSRLERQAGQAAGASVTQALRGIAVNPLPWSILLGSLSSGLALVPPAPMRQVVTLLAQSASPVALFTLGCMLARPSIRRTAALGTSTKVHSDVGRLIAYKLVLHPLLVLLAGRAAIKVGVPLDAYSAMVLVMVAALPSASNVPVLAERFGADGGRLARIVMGSTVAAFVSFSIVAMTVVPTTLFRPD
nr:AEC family transporter [uncultured Ralstonia sp.]